MSRPLREGQPLCGAGLGSTGAICILAPGHAPTGDPPEVEHEAPDGTTWRAPVEAKVIPLREAKLEPSREMIATLEKLLERAKRGEILALAVAAQVRPGCTASVYCLGEGGDIAHLVTALERLKLRLLAIT